MKISKYIILSGCFLAVIAGCNDNLDIEPLSSVTPEKYLWTEEQLAAYTINYYTSSSYEAGSSSTGGMLDSYGEGDPTKSSYFLDTYTDNSVGKSLDNRYLPGFLRVGDSGGYWTFSNIYKLNYFLETVLPRFKAGEITGNQDNVKHYIGEGFFLRAHEYFFRLRKLGDFPIIKKVLPDDQSVLTEASKRSPRNEVARFILSDLDEAIGLLSNSTVGGKARITKNAALLLKARVALFEATWLKYHAGTSQVPNGPGWPGAEKDYNRGYQYPSGSLENEVDFFLTEAIDASKQVADAFTLTPNNKIIREKSGDAVNPYYDMFAGKDPSSYSEVIMYRLYNSGLKIKHGYNQGVFYGYSKGYTNQFEKAFLMENGLPYYDSDSEYAGDDYVGDTKKKRDWRWRLFMKAPGEVKVIENATAIIKYPDPPEVDKSDYTKSTSTGYLLGKGASYDYNMSVSDETAFVTFRAAEAYLIYMEAYYLKYNSLDDKAKKYWRDLRNRAGVDPDFQKTIDATIMTKEAELDWGAYSHGQIVDATLYNIRRERRCELIGEGFRYDDLIRWRALDQLNGFQLEGCKIWGPMKSLYGDRLVTDQTDPSKNNVSSPSLSEYIRPFQRTTDNNNYYNGLFFCNAHYLSPIAVKHFLLTTSDGKTISTSPIYQNPGWSTTVGEGANLDK